MDDLWYSAFEIGTHSIYYSISININFLTPSSNISNTSMSNTSESTSYFSSSIRLGSFKNADFDKNKTVLAKIIGVFQKKNILPNFFK